jgi:hypothetical protein
MALDYTRTCIARWYELGTVDHQLANQLDRATAARRDVLIAGLVDATAKAGEPAETSPPEVLPVTASVPPPVPAEAQETRAEVPRVGEETPPETATAPPTAVEQPGPAPAWREPAPMQLRRSVGEVLLDVGTIRLMLFTGATLLAIGTMVYLRDALRVQLQRSIIQAVLLALSTVGVLAAGAALIKKARDRFEQLLFGRGFLLLGALLVPLNPWFLVRSGLVEDRGNAWAVGLGCFLLYSFLALWLAERSFVVLSYAAAVLTAWLTVFKLAGPSPAGAYGLALGVVSVLFVLAEYPTERMGAGHKWERFGGPLFTSGHIGILVAAVLFAGLIGALPPDVVVAVRYLEGHAYQPDYGIATAALAAGAYAWSAWRRPTRAFATLCLLASLYAVGLILDSRSATHYQWYVTAAAVALVLCIAERLLAGLEAWALPTRVVSLVVSAATLAAAVGYGLRFASGADTRWHVAAGSLLLAAGLLAACYGRGRAAEALPIPLLWTLSLACLLRELGVPGEFGNAILVAALGAAGPLSSLIPDRHRGPREGGRLGASLMIYCFLPVVIYWIVQYGSSDTWRAVPLALVTATAFWVHALAARRSIDRMVHFASSALLTQTSAWLLAVQVRHSFDYSDRYDVFLLAVLPWVFLVAWRTATGTADWWADWSRVARVACTASAVLVALAALPLAADARLAIDANFLLGGAFLVACGGPFAGAAMSRDGLAATVDAVLADVLLALAWLAATQGTSWWADTVVISYVGVGLLPFLLSGVGLAGRRWVAISTTSAVIAAVVAVAASFWVVSSSLQVMNPALRENRLFLATILCCYGLVSARLVATGWAVLFAAQAAATGLVAVHNAMLVAQDVAIAAQVIAALAGTILVLTSRISLGRAFGGALGFLANGSAALAAAHVFVAYASPSQPAPAAAAVSFGLTALAYIAGAAASERYSPRDLALRNVGLVALLATASVALHAAGFTTPALQHEPMVLIIAVAVSVMVVSGDEWACTQGTPIALTVLGGLLTVLGLGTVIPDSSVSDWTAGEYASLICEVTGVYAIGALRRSRACVVGVILAGSLALALCLEHHDASQSTLVATFAGVFASLHIVATLGRRLGEDWLGEVCTPFAHGIAVVTALAGVVAGLDALDGPVAELTTPVMAAAALTASSWAATRCSSSGRAVYGVGWRLAMLGTYFLFGQRLGLETWADTWFYNVPVGTVLVIVGLVAADKDKLSVQLLLLLGSLLLTAPMFLHALDNRYVQEVSPVGYDMATIGLGLALATTGVLLQVRVPLLVGGSAFAADLAVVVLSQVKWGEVPLSIYAAVTGAAMFGVAWALLYRREQIGRAVAGVRSLVGTVRAWR